MLEHGVLPLRNKNSTLSFCLGRPIHLHSASHHRTSGPIATALGLSVCLHLIIYCTQFVLSVISYRTIVLPSKPHCTIAHIQNDYSRLNSGSTASAQRHAVPGELQFTGRLGCGKGRSNAAAICRSQAQHRQDEACAAAPSRSRATSSRRWVNNSCARLAFAPSPMRMSSVDLLCG